MAAQPNNSTHLLPHNPSIKQQRIKIQNKHGEKLVGTLHETGSTEIVILCHGFRSSKEHTIMVNIADALGKEGISAFRFDFSGNGESEGSFEFGNYHKETDDLRAVIEHFRGENRVICAIFGHSKAGSVVLLYASRYQDVPTVVNASGRFDLKSGLIDRLGKDFMLRIKRDGFVDVKSEADCFRVTEESLMERLNSCMHEACLQIDKDCRVLTVHGSADEVIPVEDALEYAKIIPNHKLHIIEGANHVYTSHQAELAPPVVAFIKEWVEKTWKLRIPPKVRIFLWKACRRMLPTRDMMRQRRMEVSEVCSVCNADEETAGHIFISCSVVENVGAQWVFPYYPKAKEVSLNGSKKF